MAMPTSARNTATPAASLDERAGDVTPDRGRRPGARAAIPRRAWRSRPRQSARPEPQRQPVGPPDCRPVLDDLQFPDEKTEPRDHEPNPMSASPSDPRQLRALRSEVVAQRAARRCSRGVGHRLSTPPRSHEPWDQPSPQARPRPHDRRSDPERPARRLDRLVHGAQRGDRIIAQPVRSYSSVSGRCW